LQKYQQAQYQQEYLATLNLQATTEPLSINEATIQANLTTELHGELLALQLWQEILAANPNHARANYQVGKVLVNRGHMSGCVYLEQAIALDPDLVIPSCEELYRFHTFQGNLDSAEIYLQWRQQHLPKQWRSKLEGKIEDTDRFIPHDLAPDAIAEICQKLSKYSSIERAYLVCKPRQVFPDLPLYVLGIKLANTKSRNHHKRQAESELERDLCDRLLTELNFSRRLVIATFDSKKSPSTNYRDWKLIENIQKIPDSHIL
jgi:hypothetical protein